ncbi:MAG: hypothetical protein AAGD38_15260 [Acidobacteriota bacterium]
MNRRLFLTRGLILALLLVAAPGLTAAESLTDVEVLRSWEHTVKIDNEDVFRRVEIIFDYARGEAFERTYDVKGAMISEKRAPTPSPSEAELERAIEIIRNDIELNSLVQSLELRLEGGFTLREDADQPCGPGTRCLQIFASEPEGELPRFRAVVDLVNGQIKYRDLDRWQVEEGDRK